MSERIKIGEAVIDQQGALQTVATYYEGHLNLDNYQNWGGEHVYGFTGPETRQVTKRLELHMIEPISQPILTEEVSVAAHGLEANQPVTIS